MGIAKRGLLMLAGIAVGAGAVVLPAAAWAPVEPVAPGAPVERVEAGQTVIVGGEPVTLTRDDVVLPVAPVEAEPANIGIDDGSAPVDPGTLPEIGEPVDCDVDCVIDSTPVVEEDAPGWDCRTMGNGLCGVEVHGTVYVLDFHTMTFTERG